MILEGPNLNRLGMRDATQYGNFSMAQLHEGLQRQFMGQATLRFHQSNLEGELINRLQEAAEDPACQGVVLNPGGYGHTSVALADAVADAMLAGRRVIEVHLSNIAAREEYRHTSLTGAKAAGVISGFGADSYLAAILLIQQQLKLS